MRRRSVAAISTFTALLPVMACGQRARPQAAQHGTGATPVLPAPDAGRTSARSTGSTWEGAIGVDPSLPFVLAEIAGEVDAFVRFDPSRVSPDARLEIAEIEANYFDLELGWQTRSVHRLRSRFTGGWDRFHEEIAPSIREAAHLPKELRLAFHKEWFFTDQFTARVLRTPWLATAEDVDSVEVKPFSLSMNDNGKKSERRLAAVVVTFSEKATERLERWAELHEGAEVAVVVDGRIDYVERSRSLSPTMLIKRLWIEPDRARAEAESLARRIRASGT